MSSTLLIILGFIILGGVILSIIFYSFQKINAKIDIFSNKDTSIDLSPIINIQNQLVGGLNSLNQYVQNQDLKISENLTKSAQISELLFNQNKELSLKMTENNTEHSQKNIQIHDLIQEIKDNSHHSSNNLSESIVTANTIADTSNKEILNLRQNIAQINGLLDTNSKNSELTKSSIQKLEQLFLGSKTKGEAGENILEYSFSNLPAEWRVNNFKVNGKNVEFGLKLNNGLILPIDAKFPATRQIEELLDTQDAKRRQELKQEIEKAVYSKALEVSKYIEPNITTPFGVAAIPDSAFEITSKIHAELLKDKITVISYSMFVPYLLLVLNTYSQSTQQIDLSKLQSCLDTVTKNVDKIQNEIDGRYAKGITMLTNAKDEVRASGTKINSAILSLKK